MNFHQIIFLPYVPVSWRALVAVVGNWCVVATALAASPPVAQNAAAHWETISNRWGRVEIAEVKKAAGEGNAAADYFLGRAYLVGLGVATNRSEAEKWIRQAAELGLAEIDRRLQKIAPPLRGEARQWRDLAASAMARAT